MFNPDKFKPNPSYGKGVFRRRIRLVRTAVSKDTGQVHGALEDCNHGFQSTVIYRDGKVLDVKPQFMRIPFTTCDGAWKPLQNLVGAAINSTPSVLLAIAPPLSNCTHLHDLTLLAIAHTQRLETIVQYDIEVTDAVDHVSHLRVWRSGDDGERMLVHHWQSKNYMLVDPPELKDKPLFMGFSRWANEKFSGIANEAAFVLQKGNLVSIGRMLDVDAMQGSRAADENGSVSCFTYSPPNNAIATRIGKTVRDFTDCEEQLLKFV
jgi:hypothetical protein